MKLKPVLSFMLPFHNFLLSKSGCATVFFNADNYIPCVKFISTIPNQKQSEATDRREGTSLLRLANLLQFPHPPPGVHHWPRSSWVLREEEK